MNKIENNEYVVAIGFVLACVIVGAISGLISNNSMDVYDNLNLPALQPPGFLFPIVWTILYILMGLALFLIYRSESKDKKIAYMIFIAQLAVNFLWAPIFFVYSEYLLALVWIVILWVLIVINIYLFWRIEEKAGYILLPYIIWVTFATYLTYSVYVLN